MKWLQIWPHILLKQRIYLSICMEIMYLACRAMTHCDSQPALMNDNDTMHHINITTWIHVMLRILIDGLCDYWVYGVTMGFMWSNVFSFYFFRSKAPLVKPAGKTHSVSHSCAVNFFFLETAMLHQILYSMFYIRGSLHFLAKPLNKNSNVP